ncbi:hypothetical protein [Enterococcus faecium]|uniref:hypothetical protein n=1 Tax=Enterococcus faecium TaxID=1352 RepID=UPI0007DAB76F|nr:hypothetical protein [Enterococcus faecium]MDB7365927.1 hypothetical protein [Enterococcus faecium]MDB7519928.1 hypothetical protein [Enterococcus faecium]MDB7522545.1 hypothetical protein [Enterococcus faecium]MDB7525099.1 hypothetical protein [Enterococcus faecium]MDB7527706.1 hypothetical protein [Enterococcus faecium]
MTSFVGLLFILGCVGIWYFTKKYKNNKYRNYSIILAIICVIIIGINGEIQHHAQERQDELAIKVSEENDYGDNEAQFNTNSAGTAIIKGKTLPNAKVTLTPDAEAKETGFKNQKTTADKKGTFKFSVDLTKEQGLEAFTLEADSKGLNKESLDVSVFNDSKAYNDAQAAIEKQEAEKKAKEDAKKKAEKEAADAAQAEAKKKEAEAKAAEDAKKKDITVLSNDPTIEQRTILNDLAQQQFEQQYPYKGSKIHSIMGVIQDWTQKDGGWYYKAEATIANAFNAERDTTIEITITPVSSNSGNVTIIDY